MDEASQLDLHWWIHQLRSHNGRPVMTPVASLIITSDASNIGWGATCQNSHTGGPWSSKERKAHINWLELKAAFLALNTFVSNRRNIYVLLLIDNVAAISFIGHKGGTHSRRLSDLALMIWAWCLQRNIIICAEHIPGVDNVGADKESRNLVGLGGMDAQQRDFQKDPQEVGPSGGGPLRSQAQSPTPEILQLQTRPWSGSDRCLSSVVEGSKPLRFSTIQSSRKMSEKDKAGASPVGSDCSSVAGSIRVSHHVGELSRCTSSFASFPPCIGEFSGADTSTSEEQQSQIDRLESVRKSVEDRGISKEAF